MVVDILKLTAAIAVLAIMAGCGVDAGARVGGYGVRAGVGTTAPTTYVAAPAPPPANITVVNPVTGPGLPPPLPE